MPLAQWPEGDQRAWAAAFQDGDPLEPGGLAVEWAPATRKFVASGYGILDLTAALLAPTPLADPGEPNDDVASARMVTTRLKPSGRASGRVAAFEDPRDDLRIWLPKGKRLTVTATTESTVALSLRTSGSGQLAHSSTSTGKPVLTYRNGGAGRAAFVVVSPAQGVRTSDYALTFAVK